MPPAKPSLGHCAVSVVIFSIRAYVSRVPKALCRRFIPSERPRVSAGAPRLAQVSEARQQTCERSWIHPWPSEPFWLPLRVCGHPCRRGGALAGSGSTDPGHGGAHADRACWGRFCRGTVGLPPGAPRLPWPWARGAVCALCCLGGSGWAPRWLRDMPQALWAVHGLHLGVSPRALGCRHGPSRPWRCAGGLWSKAWRRLC